MKNIKKLLSIVMMLALVLSLGTQAFAARVDIEPSATNPDMGFNYQFWQIFKGSTGPNQDPAVTPNPESGYGKSITIGDIEWGDSIAAAKDGADGLITELKKAFTDLDGSFYLDDGTDGDGAITVQDVAAYLGKNMVFDNAKANTFAQVVYDYLMAQGVAALYTKAAPGRYEIDKGYYVIVEQNDATSGKIINPALLQLTDMGDITIKQKAEIPSVEKKIKDINDSDKSEADNGTWQDSADHDIGDHIEYKLTAKVGSGYAQFDKYYLNLVDTLSKGLTYDNNAVVTLYSADRAQSYVLGSQTKGLENAIADPQVDSAEDAELLKDDYVGGHTLRWNFTLKDADQTKLPFVDADGNWEVGDGWYIEITYTATLNEQAIIGMKGNPNTLKLEYNRKPNGDEKGTIGPDTVIAFTWDQLVNKVDASGVQLKGAEFTLYKFDDSVTEAKEGYVEMDGGFWKELKATVVTDEVTFNFDGIDDGTYKLVETKVPEGYNKADDIDFKIVAKHGEKKDGEAVIESFEVLVKGEDGSYVKNDSVIKANSTTTEFKGETGEANLTSNVINQNGLELPETGGIGTTIFYIAGAILVAGAVILLVTKRRVNGASK